MFGFGKASKIKKLSNSVGLQLRDLLAFHRHMNNGNIPSKLKENNYVLGFHYMMCIHLYYFAANGKTDDLEERGFILINAMAMALDVDAHDIAQLTEKLMKDEDKEFARGMDEAKVAFEKMHSGDKDAVVEFSLNTQKIIDQKPMQKNNKEESTKNYDTPTYGIRQSDNSVRYGGGGRDSWEKKVKCTNQDCSYINVISSDVTEFKCEKCGTRLRPPIILF